MRSIYNEGAKGEIVVVKDEIPADLVDFAKEKRAKLIETLADVDDEIAELFLDEKEPSIEQIKAAIRRATISLKFTPVMMGSALADKSGGWPRAVAGWRVVVVRPVPPPMRV